MNKSEKSNNSANNGNPTSITGNGATIYMSGCGEDFYHGKNPKQIDIIKKEWTEKGSAKCSASRIS